MLGMHPSISMLGGHAGITRIAPTAIPTDVWSSWQTGIEMLRSRHYAASTEY
jgi:hypothetical protein